MKHLLNIITFTLTAGLLISPRIEGTAQTAFETVLDGDIASDSTSSFGASWGDFDGDGWIDLFVANGFGDPDLLYRNQGDGTLTRVADDNPIINRATDASVGIWADLNNDGALDLFVVGFDSPTPRGFLYLGQGDGTFVEVTEGAVVSDTLRGIGACAGDYDNDGFLDLFVVNGGTSRSQPDFLYRNLAGQSFENQTTQPIAATPDHSEGGTWSDLDSDGDLDLLVANNSGDPNRRIADRIYENLGALVPGDSSTVSFRTLEDHTLTLDGLPSNAFATGDYDNDGDLDVFLAVGAVELNNRLYRNDGDWRFEQVESAAALANGRASHCAAWADYDNDGDLDLVVGNGLDAPNFLFRNDGDGTFSRIDQETIGAHTGTSWGCAWGDYDNDGFMDLYISNSGSGVSSNRQNNRLYHNRGNENHWLKLVCRGRTSNASAVGTKIRVLATITGESRWQMREISAGGGGWLQRDPRPNFGLGDAEVVELVRIEWPSGIVQEIRDVAPNQILEVTEPPRLIITNTVTFSWPSRLEETWILESAPSAEGPWTRIDQRTQLFVGTVNGHVTITIRPDSSMEIFRLSRR